MNKIYMGIYTKPGPQEVVVFYADGSKVTHPLRHVVKHSPTGFQWGYGGSGPADLALSILHDCILDTLLVEKHYQAFKREFIEPVDRQLHIKESDILLWISEQEGEEIGRIL